MRVLVKYARTVVLAVAAVFAVGKAWGALPELHGESDESWAPGGLSVIVATVKEVARRPDFKYSAMLAPLSTLTGTFDAGLHAELPVQFYAEATGATSIDRAPSAGDMVIAVVHPRTYGWVVTISACRFMPGGSAMVKVEGLGDPKVGETLKKIQAARAKGRAEKKTEDEAKAQDAARPE